MNPGGLRAVIFDVDGTLVDSERDGHRVAFNLAFEEFGLPDRWEVEEYGRLLETTGGKSRLERWFREHGMPEDERRELAARLHERKTELFEELAAEGKVQARPGSARLIDELDRAGITVAVATTGSRRWVAPLLERLFGPDRFQVMVAGDDAPERKPDPSAYVIAVEQLGIDREAAVAVEDSRPGLEAAIGADLACVVVVNDYTADQDFTEARLVLDGFGSPESPAAVLADPGGLEPDGILDVDVLRSVLD